MHKSVLTLLMSLTLAVPMANAQSFEKSLSDANQDEATTGFIKTGYGSRRDSSPRVERSSPRTEAPPKYERPAPMPRAERQAPPPRYETPPKYERPAPAPRAERQAPPPRYEAPPKYERPAPTPMPQRSEPARQYPAPQKPAPIRVTPPAAPQKTEPARGQNPAPQQSPRAPKASLPPGVSKIAIKAREAKIEAPAAARVDQPVKVKTNRDGSSTAHYADGSSIRKGADGKVLSHFDAVTKKTVYSNKDGSTTVARPGQSVRSFADGSKIVRNPYTKEVSHFDAKTNVTTTRAPGKTIVVDHNTGAINVIKGGGRVKYTQVTNSNGYIRNVTINNVTYQRNYYYSPNPNRYGWYPTYYTPSIYASAIIMGAYLGGYYGALYAESALYPFGYGWSVWNRPMNYCWSGRSNPYGYTWDIDYAYYYRPCYSYTTAADYLLGSLFAEALENRRQARLDSDRLAAQQAQDSAQELRDAAAEDEQKAEVLRAQAAQDLAESKAIELRNKSVTLQSNEQIPASPATIEAQKATINHIASRIAKKDGQIDVADFLTTNKAVQGFQVHEALVLGVKVKAQDGSYTSANQECNLDEGDVIAVRPGFQLAAGNENIDMIVMSAVPGDCRPNTVVSIGVTNLQDMLNATVASVETGMKTMAEKKIGQ